MCKNGKGTLSVRKEKRQKSRHFFLMLFDASFNFKLTILFSRYVVTRIQCISNRRWEPYYSYSTRYHRLSLDKSPYLAYRVTLRLSFLNFDCSFLHSVVEKRYVSGLTASERIKYTHKIRTIYHKTHWRMVYICSTTYRVTRRHENWSII